MVIDLFVKKVTWPVGS